jgi:hypothetical protein
MTEIARLLKDKACYLYVIDFPNKKKYFGISSNPIDRWKQHLGEKEGKSSLPVYVALRRYPDATFTVLVKGDRTYISQLEIEAIKKFQTRNHQFGYNISIGGESGMAGRTHSDEARLKRSITMKGRKKSEEVRARLRQAAKARCITLEDRQKRSIAAKARWTEEKKRKQSLERQGAGGPRAKLTEAQVRMIRSQYVKYSHTMGSIALARIYSVSNITILQIVANETWKNLK